VTGWTEYDAAYHLLTTPLIAKRTELYIKERGFEWLELFEVSEAWSDGEALLVQAAFELWSGGCELEARRNVRLFDPVGVLDDGNLERLLEAILIRRGRRPVTG